MIRLLLALALLAALLLGAALAPVPWPVCSLGVSRGFYTITLQGWCVYE